MTRLHRYFAIGAAVALSVSGPAFAHAKLIKSNPVAGSTVKFGPKSITLTFNERIVPAFSKFTVSMPAHGGMTVPVKTVVSPDGKRLVGTLTNRLEVGAYKVTWNAAGADGHKMTGDVSFKVG